MFFRTLDLMTMGSVVANPNRGRFAGDYTSRRADQRDERAAGERAEAETVRFRARYCRRANSC